MGQIRFVTTRVFLDFGNLTAIAAASGFPKWPNYYICLRKMVWLFVGLLQPQPLRLLGRNGFDGGAVPLKWDRRRRPVEGNDGIHHPFVATARLKVYRSEERRVGKECRA